MYVSDCLRIDLRWENLEKACILIADCPGLKSFVFVIHWTSIISKLKKDRGRIETRIRRNYLNEVSLMSILNVSLFSERDSFEDLTSLKTSGSSVPLRSQLRAEKRTKTFYDKVPMESWSEVQSGPSRVFLLLVRKRTEQSFVKSGATSLTRTVPDRWSNSNPIVYK